MPIEVMKSVGVVFLLLVCLANLANGAKILFFFPMAPKSSTMTFTPLAQELAKRGHNVTIVSLFESGHTKLPTLTEIVLKAKIPDFSEKILTGNLTSWAIFNLISSNWTAHSEEMTKSIMKELTNLRFFENLDFNVVVAYGIIPTNQIGYYLARRSNATLVLYSPAQVSTIEYDIVFGQPHNTAILPFMVTSLR